MSNDPFDPYVLLDALQRHRVDYILVGGLARVIRGSSEIADVVEIRADPAADNLRRIGDAMREISTGQHTGTLHDGVRFETPHGPLLVTAPERERDTQFTLLRGHASGERLGPNLHVRVARHDDLARELDLAGNERTLRHAIEMRGLERRLERTFDLGR